MAQQAGLSDASQARAVRRTILVVEGNVQTRNCNAQELRAAGFHVLEARDGGEASVLLMGYDAVALVVADLRSPGSSNGMAISEWLARDKPNIIVLMGAHDVVDRVRALLA